MKITVQGQELAYRDKQVFTARDVLLSSEEDVVSTVEAVLYFLNEEGRLTEERRTLDLYEGDTQAAAVIRALESAPETKGLVTALPEGFRVRSVWQEEDTCYVNLSSSLMGGLAEDLPLGTALDSLSRSLCSLDAVSEVRFLVDGEFEERYGGVDFDGSICGGGRGEPEVLIQNFLLLKRESQGFRFHLYNLEAGNFFDRLRCQNLRCRKSDAIQMQSRTWGIGRI